MELNKDNSLGEWASKFSGASFVFIRNNLDFCCGGSQSLDDACSDKGIDSAEIIQEIQNVSEGKNIPNWDSMNLIKIIDEILERFHQKHRDDLKVLIPLAKKVESVHADKEDVPKGLGDFLEKLLFELESHMQKEEQILFPMIKSGQGAMAQGPIQVMMHEHVDHGKNLAKLKELAKNFELPVYACTSWIALYQGVSTLESEVMEHIATENNVLFPRALNGL